MALRRSTVRSRHAPPTSPKLLDALDQCLLLRVSHQLAMRAHDVPGRHPARRAPSARFTACAALVRARISARSYSANAVRRQHLPANALDEPLDHAGDDDIARERLPVDAPTGSVKTPRFRHPRPTPQILPAWGGNKFGRVSR
jgi:hypothetical protein